MTLHNTTERTRAPERGLGHFAMQTEESVLGLPTIRRNRGITLEQIAASTKISIRSLEAIERGNFDKLPGGIYDKSYIRQYARAIDYDESQILDVYYRAMNGTDPSRSRKSGGKGSVGDFRQAPDIAR